MTDTCIEPKPGDLLKVLRTTRLWNRNQFNQWESVLIGPGQLALVIYYKTSESEIYVITNESLGWLLSRTDNVEYI